MPTPVYPNVQVAELAKEQVKQIFTRHSFEAKDLQIVKVDNLSENPEINEMQVQITVNVTELTIVRTWKKDPPSPIGRDAE